MKKLLIIGASILQLPAIRKAKEMGFEVAVADFNPKAVGIPFADRYYNCSTLDKEGILNVAREFCPDGIMTTATDMPMRVIAYVCSRTGLNGPSEECAFCCTDKVAMIKKFAEHGVPCPKFFEVKNSCELSKALDEMSYPCIMKPADNSGSRGVYLAKDRQSAIDNYGYVTDSSRGGEILVEEYMAGPEVSVETFVRKGIAHVLQVTDKRTTGAPHFVETGHSQPSKLNPGTILRIKEVAQKACNAVGLKDGPAHIEMIITEQGPKMVEMGARMGGDCITSHLVPLSTGIDMVKQTILYSMGEEVDLTEKINKGSAVRFISAYKKGILTDIKGLESAKNIKGVQEIGFFKQTGEKVGEVLSSSDRIGYVVAQADNADEAMKICETAVKELTIYIE